MRRLPRQAIAFMVGALFAGGCSTSGAGQSGMTYPAYTFACCQATDLQGWYPGATVRLHWIVQTQVETADNRPYPITLTASLTGPYADVNSLKAGAPAATTLAAATVNTDNRTPTAPTSTFNLPSDLASGFYNLAFTTDSGNGNSWGGASVISVAATGNATAPMAALNQRPLQLPVLAPNASCPASSMVTLLGTAPDYGFGTWPVFLSGQTSWHAAGQAAILIVGSSYPGPLLVRAAQLDGISKITLAEEDLSPTALEGTKAKEAQDFVAVVPGIHTAEGGLELPAVPLSTLWRAWFGILSTEGPGCFALQVDGDTFTEVIVFSVQGGPPPPG